MPTGGTLPKFSSPPVIEVVHGVQFRRLPMNAVHLGMFYGRIREGFPVIGTAPPLTPAYEFAGPTDFQFQFPFNVIGSGVDVPRALFASSDDTELLQLQPDRLVLNWKRGRENASYPYFETVSERFRVAYQQFEEFCRDESLGEIVADQCEMLYTNRFDADEDGRLPNLAEILRVWSNSAGAEWESPLDDLAFNARYILKDEHGEAVGRIAASLSALLEPTGARFYQFQVVVRGKPAGPSLADVLAFHKTARHHIVMCFTGLTTPAAHKKWGRLS